MIYWVYCCLLSLRTGLLCNFKGSRSLWKHSESSISKKLSAAVAIGAGSLLLNMSISFLLTDTHGNLGNARSALSCGLVDSSSKKLIGLQLRVTFLLVWTFLEMATEDSLLSKFSTTSDNLSLPLLVL